MSAGDHCAEENDGHWFSNLCTSNCTSIQGRPRCPLPAQWLKWATNVHRLSYVNSALLPNPLRGVKYVLGWRCICHLCVPAPLCLITLVPWCHVWTQPVVSWLGTFNIFKVISDIPFFWRLSFVCMLFWFISPHHNPTFSPFRINIIILNHLQSHF